MDIQQLTLIINLIKGLADDAMMGFVLYLAVTELLPILLGVLVICLVYQLLSHLVFMAYLGPWWKQQADRMGLNYDGYSVPSDIAKVQRAIEQMTTKVQKP